MAVRKFVVLTWFGRRFFIVISREKILESQLFRLRITKLELFDKVKIRTERLKMIWGTANEHGKAGKLTVKNEDKESQDLRLIDGRSAGMRVKRDKELSHKIKIHGSKFVLGIRHGI